MFAYLFTSSIMIIATIFSGRRQRTWWVKGFNGLSFFLLLAMSILLVIGFTCFDFSHSAVFLMQAFLITGIFYQFLKILPFTIFYKKEVPDQEGTRRGLRILAANVRMYNKRHKQLLELLEKHRPEVVLLTETDQAWLEGVCILRSVYPHYLERPQDNTYGMALYSKLPFGRAEIHYLVEEDVPSFHVELAVEENRMIQFIGLHPRPPAPWTKPENKDMELIEAAAMTNWNNQPSIVTGDLNDVGWSQVTQEFKGISGLLDPRIGRGFFNTYSAYVPFFRVPIDHFFLSPHFKLVKMERLEKFGSDHFPVMVEVVLDPAG